MSNIAIAILAAGASSRMGQPKQLLRLQGTTLLNRAIETALNTSCSSVFVVVDSVEHLSAQEHSKAALPRDPSIREAAIRVLLNSESNEGMASSIRLAVGQCLNEPTLNAVLLMNCDQPRITFDSLEQLVSNYKTGCIVVSRYANTTGSPAIFDRCFFPELLELHGDKGAKAVIKRNSKSVVEVALEEAEFDVDTPDDYQSLLQSFEGH
jgi:molybdenum cofactor cytidylyltransferase